MKALIFFSCAWISLSTAFAQRENHQSRPHQTVLITGAFRGLGELLAKDLIKRGHKVILAGRSLSTAPAWISTEPNARGIEMDMSDYKSIEAGYATALSAWGHIDAIIHNAGQVSMTPAYAIDMNDLDRVMRINFSGPIHLTQLALQSMQQNKFGRVIYISSAAAILPEKNMAVYSAGKAAAERMFTTMNQEVCTAREFAGCDIDLSVMRLTFVKGDYEPAVVASDVDDTQNKKFIEFMRFLRNNSPTDVHTVSELVHSYLIDLEPPELVTVGLDGLFVRVFAALPRSVRDFCTNAFAGLVSVGR
jgi:NADP-dependent 3-hydroxy acid dehydrogenase YdfG